MSMIKKTVERGVTAIGAVGLTTLIVWCLVKFISSIFN